VVVLLLVLLLLLEMIVGGELQSHGLRRLRKLLTEHVRVGEEKERRKERWWGVIWHKQRHEKEGLQVKVEGAVQENKSIMPHWRERACTRKA
jgi:hypothetical protein